MIGLRKDMGSHLRLLFWTRRHEGNYRRRTKPSAASRREKSKSYSRCLIAEVTMDNAIGFLGQSHNVMAMHLHHHMANSH